ncbi:N-acetylmuramoyl-L-alanine amidase [Legionella sp. D16C41]|uniref:N-acetylmuramoyl-L-alanine amidase n=1 Tax=Legionella sp. D16C41 TaxID=3402688 RepID=UPI003AF7A053
MKIRILVFSLCMCFSLNLIAAKLKAIEIKQESGRASLLFNLDKAINHKIFTLTNPDRIVVDLENTELAFDLRKLKLNSNLITRIRSGYQNKHTLRLVFEVADKVMLDAKPWSVLSKMRNVFSLNISANHVQIVAKPGKSLASLSPLPIKQVKKPLRDVIVVLDPGHGGKDPGAIGPKHTAEKNVTLAIATKLKQTIDKQPGMHAVLTRTGDYYVGLRERLAIARKHNGDVFVSIHADAFINRDSSGASVFALSQRGATSEAARWLAEKENYSELGGVNLADLDDQSGLVRTVLIDLSQTATIGASLHMGEKVLRNLNTLTKLHNNKVEQARFMVLKSPDIPSILIETGFITNPREEGNLTSARYQARLTQSIFQGLRGYFWEYPPHGTHIEALVNSKRRFTLNDNKLTKSIANQHAATVALSSK